MANPQMKRTVETVIQIQINERENILLYNSQDMLYKDTYLLSKQFSKMFLVAGAGGIILVLFLTIIVIVKQ